MDTHLLAYLAGVLDADGYISIYRKLGPMRRDGLRPVYYMARIGCNQSTRLHPDLFQSTFGGNVYQYSTDTRPRSKPLFMWNCSSHEARTATQLLLPYLRLKRFQAKKLIEFDNLISAQLDRPSRKLITEDMEAGRKLIYDAIRAANNPRNPRYLVAGQL